MDASTIKAIKDLVVAAADITHDGKQLPILTLPNDMTFHDIEKFMPGRRRFRGTYMTDSIEHFAAYVESQVGTLPNDAQKYTCFVQSEPEMSAVIPFDLGTVLEPGHGDHVAILNMKRSSPFKAMLDINNRVLDQVEFSNWIEDWRDYISISDVDGNDQTIAGAMSAIRNAKIKTGKDVDSSVGQMARAKSTLEQIDISSNASDGMPSLIVMACAPYLDLEPISETLRIEARKSGEDVIFIPRIIGFDVMFQKISEMFVDAVKEAVKTKVLLGKFKY